MDGDGYMGEFTLQHELTRQKVYFRNHKDKVMEWKSNMNTNHCMERCGLTLSLLL